MMEACVESNLLYECQERVWCERDVSKLHATGMFEVTRIDRY